MCVCEYVWKGSMCVVRVRLRVEGVFVSEVNRTAIRTISWSMGLRPDW